MYLYVYILDARARFARTLIYPVWYFDLKSEMVGRARSHPCIGFPPLPAQPPATPGNLPRNSGMQVSCFPK